MSQKEKARTVKVKDENGRDYLIPETSNQLIGTVIATASWSRFYTWQPWRTAPTDRRFLVAYRDGQSTYVSECGYEGELDVYVVYVHHKVLLANDDDALGWMDKPRPPSTVVELQVPHEDVDREWNNR
jgi:hypothetical protein